MSSRGHAEAIRSLALSFPEAREDHPFGPEAHVFKVGGGSRMFAIMGDGPPVRLTLKLTKEEREIALTLPFVSEAKYVGRYGWVTATLEDADGLEAALEWMRESYWMRAPEALRESAWTSGGG
jgi:predicted DNA-binding protein (MmcQ/YjbR family)